MTSSESIVFIQDHLGQGGVGTVNRRLMENLRDRGFSVHNLTVFKAHSIEGVTNHFLNVSPLQAILIVPLIFKLYRFFRTTKIDYVVSSKDYINIWVIASFRIARCKKSKLLVNSRVAVTEKLKHENKRIQRWCIRVARYLYRYSDFVANVSQAASMDSEQYFNLKKVYTLYNPVVDRDDLEYNVPCPQHPFFKKRGKTIVACGRLVAQKNYELMIKAFAIALAQRRDLYLIILGEGPRRSKLERMIRALGVEERVSLAGFQSNPKAFMASCDVFWLTSFFEGFGVVLVEALSVGATILSVDCPHGPREILEGGRYGRLTESLDAGVNASALLEVLDSARADPAKLKLRALDFETNICADRYLEVLREKK